MHTYIGQMHVHATYLHGFYCMTCSAYKYIYVYLFDGT